METACRHFVWDLSAQFCVVLRISHENAGAVWKSYTAAPFSVTVPRIAETAEKRKGPSERRW